MTVVMTGDIAKALQVGVNKFWGLGYTERPLELTGLFDTERTTKAYEEDVEIVGTGLFARKPEGSAIPYDKIGQGYITRYTPIMYALGVIFTYEMMADKQYDLGFKQAKYLGYSARQTQETVAANVYNRAFNTDFTFGDGAPLVSTARPNRNGGTFSNQLTTNADLSVASLKQAVIDISQFTNNRGLKIAVQPKTLVVPPELMFEAAEILKSERLAGTDLNNINSLRTETGLTYVVNHYLTDPDAWFIRTDVGGLKRFVREEVKAPQMENDFDTKNVKFSTFFREAYGLTDPRAIYGSQGS